MKRLIALILLTLTLTTCAACQPTPEKSAVQSKANGNFEKAIDAEPTAASIEVQGHISEEFTATDPKVTIILDTDVDYPEDIESIEVYEVMPEKITTEFIERAISCCMGNGEVYDPPTELTKAELDKLIKDVEAHLTDEWLNEYYNGDQHTIDEVRKMFEQRRQEYLKAYKTAPEKAERNPAEIEYKPHKYYMSKSAYKLYYDEFNDPGDAEAKLIIKHLRSDNPTEFMCVSYPDDDTICALYAYEIELDGFYPFYTLVHGIEFAKGSSFRRRFDRMDVLWGNQDEYNVVDARIGRDYAISETQKLVDSLGLSSDLAFAGCNYISAVKKAGQYGLSVPQGYWEVEFRRCTGSLTCFSTRYMTEAETAYAYSYGDEVLCARVIDEGIVSWSYQYPLKKTKTLNSGVSILSGEDILTRFREQSSVTYDCFMYKMETELNVMEDIYSDRTEVRFNSMELCAIRLIEKNTSGRYMIVPCWKFSGKRFDYDESGNRTRTQDTIMLINAIDGTLINANDCF